MSNVPAINLYSNTLSYKCEKIMTEYYEDNENAWMMTFSGLSRLRNNNNEDNNSKKEIMSSNVGSMNRK